MKYNGEAHRSEEREIPSNPCQSFRLAHDLPTEKTSISFYLIPNLYLMSLALCLVSKYSFYSIFFFFFFFTVFDASLSGIFNYQV